MNALRFTVPVIPVGVNRGKVGAGSRPHAKSPEMRAYQEAVAIYGQQARVREHLAPIVNPVDVEIWFFFPSDIPDADGPTKPTLDALQVPNARLRRVGAGILDNDRQVTDYHVHKRIDPENPRVEVVVRELAPEPVVTFTPQAVRTGFLSVLPPTKRAAIVKKRLVPSIRRPA